MAQDPKDHYIDEKTGLLVFTETYHLKRGYCCGKKCRHCPYEPRHGGGSVVRRDLRLSSGADGES